MSCGGCLVESVIQSDIAFDIESDIVFYFHSLKPVHIKTHSFKHPVINNFHSLNNPSNEKPIPGVYQGSSRRRTTINTATGKVVLNKESAKQVKTKLSKETVEQVNKHDQVF